MEMFWVLNDYLSTIPKHKIQGDLKIEFNKLKGREY